MKVWWAAFLVPQQGGPDIIPIKKQPARAWKANVGYAALLNGLSKGSLTEGEALAKLFKIQKRWRRWVLIRWRRHYRGGIIYFAHSP